MDRYEISVIVTIDANNEEEALDRLADMLFKLVDQGYSDMDWVSYGARLQF